MSKLSRALVSHDTGTVFPARSPVSFDLDHGTLPQQLDAAQIIQRKLGFRLSVTYGVDKHDPCGLDAAERQARALVIEGIFGEFRVPLMEVMRALSEHDVRGAKDRVAEIMRQMFD